MRAGGNEGDIPIGWESLSLGEVCLGVSKIDPLDLGRDEFKYIDIGSIDSSTNSVGSPQLLKVVDAPGRARQLVRGGDSVFSTVRPYLRNIAYVDEHLDGEIASTGFCVLRPNPSKVLPRFLRFFAISDNLLEQVLPLQRGVSYPAVRDKEVLQTRIFVPPLGEQAKIVEILEEQLSRLDAALASVHAVREKSARFRRSLLHAAFTGALTGHDVSSETLPEGWEQKMLGEVVVDIQSGFASGKHNSSGVGVIHMRPMNVSRNGTLDFSETKHVEDTSTRRLQHGDVLFNNTNSAALVGKTAYVNSDVELAFSNHMTRVRTDISRLDAKFLATQLHALWMNGYFEEICSNHVNQASVSAKRLKDVEINLPSVVEQKEIIEILEEYLSRLDASLAVVDVIEKNASAFRRSLLHAAFSGNLTKEWREGAYV